MSSLPRVRTLDEKNTSDPTLKASENRANGCERLGRVGGTQLGGHRKGKGRKQHPIQKQMTGIGKHGDCIRSQERSWNPWNPPNWFLSQGNEFALKIHQWQNEWLKHMPWSSMVYRCLTWNKPFSGPFSGASQLNSFDIRCKCQAPGAPGVVRSPRAAQGTSGPNPKTLGASWPKPSPLRLGRGAPRAAAAAWRQCLGKRSKELVSAVFPLQNKEKNHPAAPAGIGFQSHPGAVDVTCTPTFFVWTRHPPMELLVYQGDRLGRFQLHWTLRVSLGHWPPQASGVLR